MPLVARKGSTDTLLVYPPRQWLAQPSAADIRTGTPSTPMPDEGSETSLTRDTVSTTLTAAATRGATSVAVTSATGITAGRRYLITSNGAKHLVEVEAISSLTVYLTEPLLADVASAAAFVGLASWIALTTGETSDVGTGRAIYRLTLDGVIRRFEDTLRIEVTPFAHSLTSAKLTRRSDVTRLRTARDLLLSETIEEAWEHELRPKLRARGITEHRIKTPDALDPPHIEAVLLVLLRGSDVSEERVQAQEKRLNDKIAEALASRDFWYEEEASTVKPDVRQHLDDREIWRLTR